MGFLARRRANKREKKLVKVADRDKQAQACDRIIVLVEMTDNADYKSTLEKNLEDMKFISPCSTASAEKAESKILAKLDDIKIVLSNPRKDKQVADELFELNVLITERKVITN